MLENVIQGGISGKERYICFFGAVHIYRDGTKGGCSYIGRPPSMQLCGTSLRPTARCILTHGHTWKKGGRDG